MLNKKGLVKTDRLQILTGLVLFLLSVNTAWGSHYGHIEKRSYGVNPTMPGKGASVKMEVSCYNLWSGRYIDCNFTHKVIGLKEPAGDPSNNGGHNHADDRPLGSLQYGGADEDPSSLGINGNTSYFIAFITHSMPDVSGNIVTESTITLPRPWQCVWDCFTRNSSKYEDTIYVGFSLTELTATASDNFVFKPPYGTDVEHPNRHSGTAVLFDGIKKSPRYTMKRRIVSQE